MLSTRTTNLSLLLLAAALMASPDSLATQHEPCVPDCAGKFCGYNGCGGSCGVCSPGKNCDPTDGQCYASCTPWCDANGYVCGPDGCGSQNGCGTCLPGQQCLQGQCTGTCTPQCANKACGPDGCEIGNMCGWCNADMYCVDGDCVDASECEPNCNMFTDGGWVPKHCGDDGCGGECGLCMGVYVCDEANFVCVECGDFAFPCPDPDPDPDPDPTCVPACDGVDCGPDGCTGSCGVCDPGLFCVHGLCMNCSPACGDAVCGGDGCGGSCGVCDLGFSCVEGACEQAATSTCVPNCAGKSCGSDGCTGLCGQCPAGQACDVDGHCATSGGGWSEPVGGTFSACEPGEIYNELTQDCVLDDGGEGGLAPPGEGGCGGAPVGHGLWTLLIGAWALTRRRRRA